MVVVVAVVMLRRLCSYATVPLSQCTTILSFAILRSQFVTLNGNNSSYHQQSMSLCSWAAAGRESERKEERDATTVQCAITQHTATDRTAHRLTRTSSTISYLPGLFHQQTVSEAAVRRRQQEQPLERERDDRFV